MTLRTQFIDGEWTRATGEKRLLSRNPFQLDEIVGECEVAANVQVEEAMRSARFRVQSWGDEDPVIRAGLLDDVAAALRSNARELSELISREVGKPVTESCAEVELASRVVKFYAQESLTFDGDVFSAGRKHLSFTKRFPIGVLGVITPFNFPLSIAMWKIAPAIARGNAVVWKPAPFSIELSAVTVEIFNSVLPPGVVNLLYGNGEVFEGLLTNGVNAITFTGSTNIGRTVAIRCAEAGIPCQCEMGGKNASVILRDADLKVAARAIGKAAFGYAGQKCTATSRILVERPVWDSFLSQMGASMEQLIMGDPLDKSTEVGPVISWDKAQQIKKIGEDAIARVGAPVIRKVAPFSSGAWCDLLVFAPVLKEDVIHRTELFGPILVALPFDGVAEAIELNNDVPFGLVASIFTRDQDAALRFWSRAEAGIIRVNRGTTGLDVGVPFGGENGSGIGDKELGVSASEFSTLTRSIWVQAS